MGIPAKAKQFKFQNMKIGTVHTYVRFKNNIFDRKFLRIGQARQKMSGNNFQKLRDIKEKCVTYQGLFQYCIFNNSIPFSKLF